MQAKVLPRTLWTRHQRRQSKNPYGVQWRCTDDLGKVYFQCCVQTSFSRTIMELKPPFSLTGCICRGKSATTIQPSGCTDMVLLIACLLSFLGNRPRNTATLNLKAPYARNTETFCSDSQMLCMNASESVKFAFLLSVSPFLFPP